MHRRNKRPDRVKGYLPPTLLWIPDWTDASAYPYGKKLSSTQWAWEFLRRNESYRQTTHEFCYALPTTPPELLAAAKETRVERVDDYTLDITHSHQDLEQYNETIEFFYLQFGLMCFPPACSDDAPYIRFKPLQIPPEQNDMARAIIENMSQFILSLNGGNIHLEDAMQLSSDLAKLRTTMGSKHKRVREGVYADYLRLLDANECKATSLEVAHELYPGQSGGEDRAKKALDAAIKLSERDYLIIGQKGI